MNRTPAQRFAILLVMALHLFAWTGDALGFHPCPHHSAIPGAVHGTAMAHGGHAGHGQENHGGKAEHDACTCVSACPSAAPALLPHAAPTLAAAVTDAPTDVQTSAGVSLPRFRPYVLPYGQAPPA